MALFTILFIAFLARHGRLAGMSTAADLKPTVNGFLRMAGVLVFLWVGFEVSAGASEEMHNPRRDVPRMIVGSGIVAVFLYGLAVAGIILVIPKTGLSSVAGFADAYKAVSRSMHSPSLDVTFGILIILTLIGSGAVWLEGADRIQAIAALDGAAPRWLGRFSSAGTPITVNLMSGVIGSVFVFCVFLITKGSLAHFFSLMIALTISATALCYVFVFPALIVLRHRHPDTHRPYRVPGGMAGAWAAVVLTEVFVAVTAITVLWPGAVNSLLGQSYSMQRSWGVSRAFFESVTLGALGVMVLLGVVFWAVGAANRRHGLTGEAEFRPDEETASGRPHG